MNDFISRQEMWELISELQNLYEEERKTAEDCEEESMYVGSINALTAMEDGLSDIPAADVRPVVRGNWEPVKTIGGSEFIKCSECGYKEYDHVKYTHFNFCPHCGADMRGEKV